MRKKSSKKTFFHPLQALAQFLQLRIQDLFLLLLGNFTIAFALVNIHIPAQITEGGALGLVLLLSKLFGWDPALLSMLVDGLLYAFGIFLLGRGFLRKAIFSSLVYASLYALLLRLGPILPSLYGHPFWAAVAGGFLLGSGCGLVVTRGGASGGDDCYALMVAKYSKLSLAQAYFTSDATVLLASFLVYLPLENVLFSLLTTIISSYVIGQFELHLPAPQVEGVQQGA